MKFLKRVPDSSGEWSEFSKSQIPNPEFYEKKGSKKSYQSFSRISDIFGCPFNFVFVSY